MGKRTGNWKLFSVAAFGIALACCPSRADEKGNGPDQNRTGKGSAVIEVDLDRLSPDLVKRLLVELSRGGGVDQRNSGRGKDHSPAIVLTYAAPAGERPPEKKRAAPQPPAAPPDATTEDQEALQGAWEGQSAEQDGTALPEEEAKKMRVSIKGDRMIFIPGGEWTRLRIKLDPAKSPKVLYLTAIEGPDKNKPVPAIYRLDQAADTLTLCWDTKEGKAVPADFATKKGSGLILIVLKHELRPPAGKE